MYEGYRIEFFNSEYVLKIIDARADKHFIGIILRGSKYKPKKVLLNKPLASTVQKLIYQSKIEGKDPVLYLKILKLEISEYKTSGVVSRCEMVADFIVDDHEQLKLVDQKSYVINEPGGKSLVAHRRNLIRLIQQALDDFDEENFSQQVLLNHDDLFTREKYLLEPYPIQHPNTRLEPGLYQSVLDFRENAPSVKDGYLVDWNPNSTRDRIRVKIRSDSTHRMIKNLWGFSDGINSYINLGGSYHLIERIKKGDFEFKVDARYYSLIASIVGIGVGGLLGGVIAATTMRRDSFEFQIDLVTGNLLLLEDVRPSKWTFLRNSKATSSGILTVAINGVEIGTLEHNKSMFVTEVPNSIEIGEISIVENGLINPIQVKNLEGKNRFFLIERKGNDIEIRELRGQQADYHIGKIGKALRKQ